MIPVDLNRLWGPTRAETSTTDSGVCRIPLPEGAYLATWERRHVTKYHVRWPGTWLDRLRPRTSIVFQIDVPGGIPAKRKLWERDGVYGLYIHTETLEQAVASLVASVSAKRRRNRGPHDLTAPLTADEYIREDA